MRALTEREVRGSFVNCSKGEAQRIAVPRDLAERPWDDLDFLGWRDPGAPDRSYLVAERAGAVVGVALRLPTQQRSFLKSTMCSLCMTGHPGNGVSLMTARKAGRAGREGNAAGIHICTDLACSLYVRGRKLPASGIRFEESLTVEEQAARITTRLHAFLDRVAAAAS